MKAEFTLPPELVDAIAGKVIEQLKPILKHDQEGDKLLTVNDLCLYLHVKRDWIYQQVHAEAIPFLKAGNKLLFRKAEIDKYLEGAEK